VDPWIIGLVALSAVLHVAWNIRLKTAGDPLRAATIGMLAASIGIVPAGVIAWWASGAPALPLEGIALGIGSGAVEALYFIFLAAAYRRGDLSVVYPLARGTAPLLAVLVGVGLLGERLGLGGSLGVAGLLAGFLWLQRPWRAIALARSRGDAVRGSVDTSILFALATGVTIASYTALDRLGVRLIEPLPYAAILWATCCVALVLWIGLAAGGDLLRHGPSATRSAAIGGWLTLGAYLCVLVALSVAPLSGVAPLRESATVFAAAWGSVRLGEAADRAEIGRRVGASLLIVGGALLLAIGD
jgi:drug/metabolite transporter (DMT)-like permease